MACSYCISVDLLSYRLVYQKTTTNNFNSYRNLSQQIYLSHNHKLFKTFTIETFTSYFRCLSLPPLDLSFRMLTFPILLCHLEFEILKNLKSSLQIFAVCPYSLWTWHFECWHSPCYFITKPSYYQKASYHVQF